MTKDSKTTRIVRQGLTAQEKTGIEKLTNNVMEKNLEMLVKLFELMSKQIDPKTMPEVSVALEETTKMLIERAKCAIENILIGLEKDIIDGKITNLETINKIKGYRTMLDAL